MGIRNTAEGWGWPSRLLHWVIALMIIAALGFGKYVARLDPYDKLEPVNQHKAFGMVILGLVLVRIVWRGLFSGRAPRMPDHMRPWERFMAHAGHLALYGLMLAMPLLGWAAVSVSPFFAPFEVGPVTFGRLITPEQAEALLRGGGLVTASDAAAAANEVAVWFKRFHALCGWALILTVLGHAGFALKHHVLNRDTVLRRMIRGR